MDDLLELQKQQIEALQKELERKSSLLAQATEIIEGLYKILKEDQEDFFKASLAELERFEKEV